MAEAFAWGLNAGSSLLLGGARTAKPGRPAHAWTRHGLRCGRPDQRRCLRARRGLLRHSGWERGGGARSVRGSLRLLLRGSRHRPLRRRGKEKCGRCQDAGSSLAIVLGPSLLEGGRVSGAREMRSAAQIGAVDLPGRGMRMILPCFRVLRDDPISRNDARGRAAPQPSPTNTSHSCTHSDAR